MEAAVRLVKGLERSKAGIWSVALDRHLQHGVEAITVENGRGGARVVSQSSTTGS